VACVCHADKKIGVSLAGDEMNSHARVLKVVIADIRVVNIYLSNGNPIGTDKFAHKLAWIDRLMAQMKHWAIEVMPTLSMLDPGETKFRDFA
jgi:exodeoxyribonuclease-3